MNWLIKNFFRGLIIVVPVLLTVYLIYEAIVRIDRLLALPTPGLGIAILVAGIIAVGALGSNFVGRHIVRLTETIFSRAPIIRIVYAAIRDLLEAFVGDKRRFDRPVAVSLSESGDLRTLGFVTQEDLSYLALSGYVAVYLPFSYSVAGSLVIVPVSRVMKLDVDSASIMGLIVSGGVSRV